MEDWEKNVEAVLGDDTERCHDNALRFRAHLKAVLTFPITTTGREDFPWEEPYVFGASRKDEHARLRKTNPSYMDTFDLIDILPPDEDDDLVAKIVRKSDKKKFSIGLSWLTTETENGPAFRELDNYATWFANY